MKIEKIEKKKFGSRVARPHTHVPAEMVLLHVQPGNVCTLLLFFSHHIRRRSSGLTYIASPGATSKHA